MTHLLWLALVAASGGEMEPVRSRDEVAARRVADGLIAETTWRLVDTATGTKYEKSDDLAPSKTVRSPDGKVLVAVELKDGRPLWSVACGDNQIHPKRPARRGDCAG